MDEITNSAPQVAASEPGTAPAETVKVFTQEQVNRIAADAREQGRSSAAQQRPPAQKPAEKIAEPDLRAELDEMRLRSAFDKRAGKFDLDDKASDRLFNLFKTERPEDPSAWMTETAALFGLKGHNVNTSNQSNPGASATPVPPASAPSAPAKVDAMTSSGLVDIFNLSADQVAQLGPSGLRTQFEKILSVGHQMQGAPQRPQMAPRK